MKNREVELEAKLKEEERLVAFNAENLDKVKMDG